MGPHIYKGGTIMSWNNKNILVTGGTGSFGNAFVEYITENFHDSSITVFSRDELKQSDMKKKFPGAKYVVGDVRDYEQLKDAMQGIDIVVHAAALKRIEVGEAQPWQVIQTNVVGTHNVVKAAQHCGVGTLIGLSTDKAAAPINLYGGTKLCLEKIIQSVRGNNIGRVSDINGTMRAMCVRYGNVAGSRGSVIPLFLDQAKTGKFTVTDTRMTRFIITLKEAVELVIMAGYRGKGGEVFIPNIPSVKITDLCKYIEPEANVETIGIRPGEKLHEVMVTEEESRDTLFWKAENVYIVNPITSYLAKKFKDQPILDPRYYEDTVELKDEFKFASNVNNEWITEKRMKEIIEEVRNASS